MINCALKIKFPFIQNKKRTRAHFVYLFLVPVRGAFSTLFFLASFHLNQPLHEAKKNKRYICISRGTYVFVFSLLNNKTKK